MCLIMKRILIFAAIVVSTLLTVEAKGNKEICKDHNRWLVMVGSGYSYTSDQALGGTGGVNSLIYLPHKIWGFGLDMGMNQTEGKTRVWADPSDYDIQTSWFVGPSVYLFPVNSKRHRVHISVGGNIFGYHNNYLYKSRFGEDDEISISHNQSSMYNVGFHAGLGYSLKFLKHFELGIRGYSSFFQEGFNLNALLNLSVSF